MPKIPLNIRIDPQLLKQLKAQAKKENRTLSNLVDTILRNYVKKT